MLLSELPECLQQDDANGNRRSELSVSGGRLLKKTLRPKTLLILDTSGRR